MELFDIVNKFLVNDEPVGYNTFGGGLINSTYLILTKAGKKYILQRINDNVFKDVDMLMNNIDVVTTFMKNKNIETIQMMKADNGKLYVKDDNNYFRMYEFMPNTMTFENTEGYEMVEAAASAFGKFHKSLSDLDGSKLGETIPFFHDTSKRYIDFLKTVIDDKAGRVKDCRNEIDNILKYESYYSQIVDGIKTNKIKLHVTHNDPKINNALFDTTTQKFRCVIDLDTVMPGSVLYDFGDALRSLFTGDKEDSLDYKSVNVSFEIYRHYAKAYLKEMKSALTPMEIELLPYAPFVLAMELSMRFLGDHFNGDVYFGTSRANQNLDRARTQINLGNSILENIDELKKITKEIIESL